MSDFNSEINLNGAAFKEVEEAFDIIRANFPHLAEEVRKCKLVLRQRMPTARARYSVILSNLSPGELDGLEEKERTLLGRAANWLAGTKYFPLKGDEYADERIKATPAEEIKAFRASHGISQSKLADYLEIPKKTLENWEQDRTKAPSFLRRALADIAREISLEAATE